MKAIISQPRYLPALNYIQRLFFADVFIVFDVVQRQARGWENRNKLLLPDPTWLTIPVASSSRSIIKDTKILNTDWIENHKNKIGFYYKNAPFFDSKLLDFIYNIEAPSDNSYVDVLLSLMNNICSALSFKPALVRASDLLLPEDYQENGVRLLRIVCQRSGASCYVSGPNGKEYGVDDEFSRHNIPVVYHNFIHPEYFQARHDFAPYMGCLDALFYCGREWLFEFVRKKPRLVKS